VSDPREKGAKKWDPESVTTPEATPNARPFTE
jgi:hypothetical protein